MGGLHSRLYRPGPRAGRTAGGSPNGPCARPSRTSPITPFEIAARGPIVAGALLTPHVVLPPMGGRGHALAGTGQCADETRTSGAHADTTGRNGMRHVHGICLAAALGIAAGLSPAGCRRVAQDQREGHRLLQQPGSDEAGREAVLDRGRHQGFKWSGDCRLQQPGRDGRQRLPDPAHDPTRGHRFRDKRHQQDGGRRSGLRRMRPCRHHQRHRHRPQGMRSLEIGHGRIHAEEIQDAA